MKLVLVWIDNTGIEVTGQFRDRLRTLPETRPALKAHAVIWGDETPAMLDRLRDYIATQKDHEWIGHFVMNEDDPNVLSAARDMAMRFHTERPIVGNARYARGKAAVHCPSNGSGNKTRAMRLCAAVASRYTNRERAYIMSHAAAKRIVDAYNAGKDARLGDRNGKLDWIME